MSPSPSGKEPRIADPSYVGRIALKLTLILLAAGGLLFLALYLLFTRPLPGTYSGVYFALRNLSTLLAPILFFTILAFALIVTAAIGILSGYALHRIAGPLYRMERALENFESGDPVKAVFFREGDQLVSLADAYNECITRIRETRMEWLAAMEHADRLCLQDSATCRAEMSNALARMSELLSRYR
ncbi:MAG: hypothetical protein FIA93_00475 [Deltaproteobacteria bacterium]|nr:hypothetical protein [Deltaproteobacteria bacterium]PWB67330.1 MAG: hypothetical protein C3F14_02465 [Deltaproteobacteria bacterium]